MSQTYRIKLETGRVVGPLDVEDLKDLYLEGAITCNEEVQEFPAGEWRSFNSFKELVIGIKSVGGKLRYQELVKKEKIEIDFDNFSPGEISLDNSSRKKKDIQFEEGFEGEIDLNTGDYRKHRPTKKKFEFDPEQKTEINPDYQEYLKKLKAEKEQEEKLQKRKEELEKKKSQKEAKEIAQTPDYENDATQVVKIKDLKMSLSKAFNEEEKQIVEKQQIRKRERIRKKREERHKQNAEIEEFELEEESNGFNIKKLIVLALIIAGAGFFLLGEKKEVKKPGLKPITTLDPEIRFLSRYDTENPEKAMNLYKKGVIETRKGSYIGYLNATKFFVESLREKFNDNKAGANLIFIYSQILHNSRKFNKDANTVFKLVSSFKSLKLKDPEYAAAIASFYLNIDKASAADSILAKYRLIPGNPVTVRLFSVYLEVLTKLKKYDKAKDYAAKLEEAPKKSHYTLKVLYKYYLSQKNSEKQVEIIKESISSFPNSVYFLLERGMLFLGQGELEEVKKIIFKINALNAESSRFYYSRYLALKGLYLTASGKIKRGLDDIKTSIKLYNDKELRKKFAQLNQSEDQEANSIILEAKTGEILNEVKELISNNQKDAALKRLLRALDMNPRHVEASIMMAELQMEKGYYDDAIKQLEAINKNTSFRTFLDYQNSLNLKYKLIDAYVRAKKVKKALTTIGLINKMTKQMKKTKDENELYIMANDDRYFIAQSKIARVRGDLTTSLLWLRKAQKVNPLNIETIDLFVNSYIQNNEYSKAKVFLDKAMELDPSNMEYRIINAKILYEVESLDTAVGYLYDVLEDYPDNPKLYAAIGIYYYQSGKLKNYKQIKKKLMSLPEKDVSLYEFLLESARLDDDYNKIVEYSREIIKLRPGDLARRLYLAQILIELKRYSEAMNELKQIEIRYEDYPKLRYFIAKLHITSGNPAKALEFAKLEVERNPTLVEGYLIQGETLFALNELQQARNSYLEAARLEPNNVDAILGIAKIAAENNQFDMAIDQFTKATTLDASRPEIYKLIGDTYRKIEQTQLAIKNYKQFLELSPNSRYKRELEAYIKKLE